MTATETATTFRVPIEAKSWMDVRFAEVNKRAAKLGLPGISYAITKI